jgi:hypothetical protein
MKRRDLLPAAASRPQTTHADKHYDQAAQQLKAHGWTVQLSKQKATVSFPKENKKITVEQFNVNAQRDKSSYDVSFESHEMYDPPRPGAHVAEHVGKDSGKRPPSE